MFKPLALAIAAGLIFTVGCEKKPGDGTKVSDYHIPTVAPAATKGPGTVFKHIQYAMFRKDPKHLEIFFPEENKVGVSSLGTTQWFHKHAGDMGLTLTADEINELGVQNLLQKGYISERWTSHEYTKILSEMDSGNRQHAEPGMEKVDQRKLDMPIFTTQMDQRTRDALNKQLKETLEENPKAAYAAGLYRVFKAIPTEGWPRITATVTMNAGRNEALHDILLKLDEELIATVTVGNNDNNPDETMFISYVQFMKMPSGIARLLGITPEVAKTPETVK